MAAAEQKPNPTNSTNPRITFENFLGQGRVNQLGGVFINGRPLPQEKRLQIVELARRGVKPCKISRELKVSHGAVSKILMRYNETGSISPGQIGGNPRSRISIQAVRQHILRICGEQPADIGAAQVQQLLVQRGICSSQNVPSTSRINRLLKAQKLHLANRKKNGKAVSRDVEGRSDHEAAANGTDVPLIPLPLMPTAPESSNNAVGNASTRPLTHSIENILGGAESSSNNDNNNNGVAVTEPTEFSSSSTSSTFNAMSASSTGSGSDEENQHQNQLQPQQQQQRAPLMSLLESRRARTSFSPEQLRLLEQTFRDNPYPGQEQKEWLVKATQLDEDKIITWFSNRRARSRRKAFQHCPSTFHQLFMPSLASSAAGGSFLADMEPLMAGNWTPKPAEPEQTEHLQQQQQQQRGHNLQQQQQQLNAFLLPPSSQQQPVLVSSAATAASAIFPPIPAALFPMFLPPHFFGNFAFSPLANLQQQHLANVGGGELDKN